MRHVLDHYFNFNSKGANIDTCVFEVVLNQQLSIKINFAKNADSRLTSLSVWKEKEHVLCVQ